MTTSHNRRAIVVGVDGSASALQAVRWAARLANRDGVPVRLVHTYRIALGLPAGITEERSLLNALREQGRRWIAEAREVVANVDLALPVEIVLDALPVAEALQRESEHAGMIVLGTRGLSAFTGLLVGSTSVAIAGKARCPVTVVRGAGPDNPPLDTGPVVVGVDGTPVSESAIAFAFAEASARGADLVALHAWTESVFSVAVAGETGTVDLDRTRQEAAETLAERLAGWQEKYPDVHVVREVVRERARRALRRLTPTAQLIIVGRQGGSGFGSLLLGSTSQYLLHHAQCPVVVTPTDLSG